MNKIHFISNRNINLLTSMNEWDYIDTKLHTGHVEIEKYFNTYRFKQNTLEFYFGELDRLFDKIKDFVLFFHGFNNNFDDSLISGWKLQQKINRDVVVFSWPSNGKLNAKDYLEDREDARKTDHAIVYLFEELRNKNKNIDLICHSMGVYLLRQAWQEYKQRSHKIFNNIILVAADEDYDAFEKKNKLKDIDKLGKVTIFYNRKDGILKYSDIAFRENLERLGRVGVKDRRVLNDNIRQIDITDDIKKHEHGYLINFGNDGFIKKLLGVLDE